LKDINDPDSKIDKIELENIDEYKKYTVGTMQKKLMGAKRALKAGVERVYWGDVRQKNPITAALNGEGTILT
jgi:acetylglutamate/LysW-gamma-L-alpha-aminoadipate kinase